MPDAGDTSQIVGAEIRRVRLAKGWSLAKLAEEADLSPTFTGSIERGTKVPTVTTLLKISRALGVSASLILEPVEREGDVVQNHDLLQLVPAYCRDVYTQGEVAAILKFIQNPVPTSVGSRT